MQSEIKFELSQCPELGLHATRVYNSVSMLPRVRLLIYLFIHLFTYKYIIYCNNRLDQVFIGFSLRL